MLKKIIDGKYLQRLDNIKQWQEKDVFKEESVSQHSYKVTIFARVLLEDIFGESKSAYVQKFKLDVITRALLHDWDEALTLRDLSHETKYNNFNGSDIRRAIDTLSKHLASHEFREEDVFGGKTDSFHMMWDMICDCPEPVRGFAKLCDWVALVFYIKRERSMGNDGLNEPWEVCKEFLPVAIENLKYALQATFSIEKMNFEELDNLIKIFDYGD